MRNILPLLLICTCWLSACQNHTDLESERVASKIEQMVKDHDIKQCDVYLDDSPRHTGASFKVENGFVVVITKNADGYTQNDYYNLTYLNHFYYQDWDASIAFYFSSH